MYKVLYGQREIRGLANYYLEPITGGYHFNYSGVLWLDYITNPNSETTLLLDTYYSFDGGLSTATDINLCVPPFYDKVNKINITFVIYVHYNILIFDNNIKYFRKWV